MPLTADVAAQQVQERLRSLHRLIYDIEAERNRNEQSIDSILRAEKAGESPSSTEDSSGSQQQQMQLKSLYKAGLQAAEAEDRVLRAALSRIYEIRTIRNERRIQARHAGNKETIGCGALMKMLLSSAQTLPLHVGRAGARAPALCGAVPAEPGHVARAGDAVAALVTVADNEDNWILAEMPAARKVTLPQMELMVSFMEEHRALARGQSLDTPQGKVAVRQQWEELAARLNAVMGHFKTGTQWRAFQEEIAPPPSPPMPDAETEVVVEYTPVFDMPLMPALLPRLPATQPSTSHVPPVEGPPSTGDSPAAAKRKHRADRQPSGNPRTALGVGGGAK